LSRLAELLSHAGGVVAFPRTNDEVAAVADAHLHLVIQTGGLQRFRAVGLLAGQAKAAEGKLRGRGCGGVAEWDGEEIVGTEGPVTLELLRKFGWVVSVGERDSVEDSGGLAVAPRGGMGAEAPAFTRTWRYERSRRPSLSGSRRLA